MSRKIVYIATSLDGFIAKKNGDIDWLEEDPSYDYYNEFIKNVEIILMGATTYLLYFSHIKDHLHFTCPFDLLIVQYFICQNIGIISMNESIYVL